MIGIVIGVKDVRGSTGASASKASSVIVASEGNVHVAFQEPSNFRMVSGLNGTVEPGLPSLPGGEIAAFEVLSSGIYATDGGGDYYQFDSASSSWSLLFSSGITDNVNDLHEENSIFYAATDYGVERFDLSANQALSSWNSGNVLTVTQLQK